jgi:hypothetical protein
MEYSMASSVEQRAEMERARSIVMMRAVMNENGPRVNDGKFIIAEQLSMGNGRKCGIPAG